ncbi:hypothetical protein F5B20DRAFT_123300 [Whalleya microplaca]|nr:hypothetical protein F5B20DRAFT_123300 [Whalleya microplaca]
MADSITETCVSPQQLVQVPIYTTDTSDSTPDHCVELPHQLQRSPMRSKDYPLESLEPNDFTRPCMGLDNSDGLNYRESLDRSKYLSLSSDFEYPDIGLPTNGHNDTTQKGQYRGHYGNYHEGGKIKPKRDDRDPTTTTTTARSRRSSGSSSSRGHSDGSSSSSGGGGGVDKRERNRMAASKCRRKQKQANNELQEKARLMSEQHGYLTTYKSSLQSEMIALKNELLLHGSCGCEPITDYLVQAAKKVVNVNADGEKTANKDVIERSSSADREIFVS